jgi:hypothetical protein
MEGNHAQQEEYSGGKKKKSYHLIEASGLGRCKEPHPTGGRKKLELFDYRRNGWVM